ncbi:MAG: hypothetical protein RBT70_07920 [Alphaproteobacteria bacterium]|jgi:hypothetical protein|nr:hypothetical protein [Alphaproteobacteria bacterium]
MSAPVVLSKSEQIALAARNMMYRLGVFGDKATSVATLVRAASVEPGLIEDILPCLGETFIAVAPSRVDALRGVSRDFFNGVFATAADLNQLKGERYDRALTLATDCAHEGVSRMFVKRSDVGALVYEASRISAANGNVGPRLELR